MDLPDRQRLSLPHLHADQPLDVALRRIGDHPLLPVVSRTNLQHLEGVVSLEDVLRAYRASFATSGAAVDALWKGLTARLQYGRDWLFMQAAKVVRGALKVLGEPAKPGAGRFIASLGGSVKQINGAMRQVAALGMGGAGERHWGSISRRLLVKSGARLRAALGANAKRISRLFVRAQLQDSQQPLRAGRGRAPLPLLVAGRGAPDELGHGRGRFAECEPQAANGRRNVNLAKSERLAC
jgi:hypothetical protein